MRFMNVFGWVTVAVWLCFFSTFGIIGYINSQTDGFEYLGGKLIGSNITHPGGKIVAEYLVKRNQSCSITITRLLNNGESSDGYREYPIGSENLVIEGESKARLVPVIYSIPENIAPGKYYLFTRYRFYCNFVDYIIPRIRTKGHFELEVQ